KPPIHVSTQEIYGKLNVQAIQSHPSVSQMLKAIEAQHFGDVCQAMGNVLEDITIRAYPEVKQIKECMLRLGADGVLMSGSGPTVFGLVSKESKVARIYNGLRGFCKDVFAVRMLT